jgi:protein PhnA
MSISQSLLDRSESRCELCSRGNELSIHVVSPRSGDNDTDVVVVCSDCSNQLEDTKNLNENHWRCLNESMWNAEPSVQVTVYRLLNELSHTSWATDLKNQIYMDETTTEWAESSDSTAIVHKDANGHILQSGDSVVLIQDLKVKGANFTAKRGTAVRRISLVHDNPNHIEGRVEDQHIVILTQYVKKT